MRNLKKVIALVAVFAMLVSTVAFATTFSDVKDDDNYAEAIEMLSNLGILTGDDQDGDGVMDFRPNDTITRAEVAAIVCRVQNLNNLAQSGTQFTDVTSSHWASGYVAQAAGKGIINGNGDGTFAPEANVKFQDVVKMFVRTIGYEPYVNANGGYPAGDLAAANRYGVLDGVISSGNEVEATRGQVAQIAFNALDTPLMDRKTYGADEEWVIYNGRNGNEFQSLLTQYLSVKKIDGTVEGTQVTGLKSANSIDTNDNAEITFAYEGMDEDYSDYKLYGVKDVKKVYEADSNASQYLGYAVNAYVKETGKSGEYDIISIAPSNRNKVASFTLDQFASATDKKIEYYKNDNDNNTTSLTLSSDILSSKAKNTGIIYNGVAYNGTNTTISSILTELKVTKDTVYSGKVTLIDNDTTNGYDVISIEVGAPAVVDEVKNSGKVAFKEVPKNSIGNKIELTFDEDENDTIIKLTKDGKKIDYTDLKEWDVLSILFNNDATKYYDVRVVDGNKVDGAISSRKASTTSADGFEYTIAGNSYDVAANCYDAKAVNKGWTVGTAGMFYVDEYGKIVAFDKNGSTTMSSTSGNYAYVLYAVATEDDFQNKTVRVQVLDKDGKVYTADIASKVRLENYGSEDKTYDVKDVSDALATKMMNQLITYEANSSGEIKTVTFPTIKGDDSSFDRAAYGDASYDEDDRTIKDIGSFDVNDDTVVFFVKADGTSKLTGLGDTNKASKSASKVGTVASIADGTYKMAVYDEDNGIAGAIVLFNTTGGISASSNIAVIDSVGEATVDSNDVLLVKYFMNGEAKESYTDEDLDSSIITKNTARGTVYKFSLSGDGSTITDAEQLATLSRENDANKGLAFKVFDKTKFDTDVDGGVKSVDTKEVMYAGPVYDYSSSSKRIRIATEKTVASTKGFDFTNTVSIKASNANVYVIDPNKKNNKLYVGDASDVDYDDELTTRANNVLADWKDSDGKAITKTTITVDGTPAVVSDAQQGLGLMDYAFAVEYDGDILDVVIYKAYDFKWSVK
jgi:hypothetical protein